MKHAFKFSSLFLACSLALSGCGGSSTTINNPNADANNNLNAGANNNNQVVAGSSIGTFLDSPVAGVTYTTSAGFTGTTDGSGHFSYNKGDTITFKLGTLVLGSTQAASLITPIDLANTNTNVSIRNNIQNNLLVLLQSLDNDPSDDVITITPASIAKVSSSLDLSQDPATFATNLSNLSITPVPLATALTNFHNALSNTSAPTSSTPLQTAKNFVTNANTIIASVNQIAQTYKPADLTGTPELAYATNAVSALALDAYQTTGGLSTTLSTPQIQTILKNASGGSPIQYSNLSNLTVTTTSAGAVNISGSFTLTYVTHYAYNSTSTPGSLSATGVYTPGTRTYTSTPVYSEPIVVTVSQFGITTNTHTSNTNFNFTLNANSSITATTTTGINATVIANSNSTITATYPSAVTLNVSSQIQNDTNPMPQTGSISLQNIALKSGVTTLNLNNLTLSGQAVNIQSPNSSVVEKVIIPTSLAFNGSIQQNQNTANVSAQIQLSGVSPTQTYTVDNNGSPSTAALANATANFSLAVSANILAGNTQHTFKANFIGNVAGSTSTAQSSMQLTLDNTSLMGSIVARAATATQTEAIGVTLIDPNGASVTIPDVKNFTSANIMVNGTSQGTISKSSSSIYQAVFTDNKIIVIAP